MTEKGLLLKVYEALRAAFGCRHWWPAESPFEVMVGAVLTQNTNWANVERAIANLKQADLLRPAAMAEAELTKLQALIRPAGYYRQKSVRLKRLAGWVARRCAPADEGLKALRGLPLDCLREELLALKGIGPETADSILLYALGQPVFVVDAYTVRILARHQLVARDSRYGEVQSFFQDGLPTDLELFKDYHAQLVEVGKRYCKRRAPRCQDCPLHPVLGAPTLEMELP